MERYTPEQFKKMNPFYIETVLDGFDQYQNQMLDGTHMDLRELMLNLAEAEHYEAVYADCYYGRLNEKEKAVLRDKYPPQVISLLESLSMAPNELFLSMNREIMEVLLTLSLDETLFSTFYFLKAGVLIWSNYGQRFPVFFRDEEARIKFNRILDK